MHRAMLHESLLQSRIRCNICQWRCQIGKGKGGVCKMYRNIEGILYNMNYAQVSSVAIDPIEKKPLFHFFPGSLAFSIGGWGCNFHCQGCQNWQISCVDIPQHGRRIEPEETVKLTKEYDCQGIAWTYNEPTMWFEYTLDSARLAKESNLYTVYVTNGYMTPQALDTIGPYLDAWRVDVKGFSDNLYRKLAGINHWRGILEVAIRAKKKWQMHIEVITNIIPGMNDDKTQLEGIADWIYDKLGELTPWHVTRFYPHHEMADSPPTPISTLERAIDIGRNAGLKFVYLGNVPGHGGENTTCYNCGNVIVKRYGYHAEVVGVRGSQCKFCRAELNIKKL
ncbi:MAG: AmmeMemoRadiSam system radical SAM enzyme [Dehalococcoidia bacterium]|nr:MAG: AmmeMemoRadiSam system radical SAM enzyme [Dehalococcoidia bacterium]